MSTSIIVQESATAFLDHDESSATGLSIIWPRCGLGNSEEKVQKTATRSRSVGGQDFATVFIDYDKNSATGKSIIWPRCEPSGTSSSAPVASVASTRANSPAASYCSTAQLSEDMPTPRQRCMPTSSNTDMDKMPPTKEKMAMFGYSLQIPKVCACGEPFRDLGGNIAKFCSECGAKRGAPQACFKDASAELDGDASSASAPTTAAGSPCLSIHSHGQSMPCTPSSRMCPSQLNLTGTTPTPKNAWASPKVADASQRSPLVVPSASRAGDASQRSPPQGLHQGIKPCDASQRTPPQDVVQRINARFSPSGDASNRSPPGVANRFNARLSAMRAGDASQRNPTSPMGGAGWGAAAAAVAATRAAAASAPQTAASDVIAAAELAKAALSAADAVKAPAPAPAPVVYSAVTPVVEAAPSVDQVATVRTGGSGVRPSESLKCWLAGSETMPTGEDLVERLRAAMPETYDD